VQSQVKKKIAKFPDTPGVYQFKHGSKILYIGKATSLRDRVRSYFTQDILNTRGPLIVKMLQKFDKVEYIKTDSVLEALILEAQLIKKHQPEANTIDKDDKSFNHVVITKEKFPRVLIIRGRELENFAKLTPIKYIFGPFTNGGQLREAMKIVRKLFPFRDKCVPAENQKPKTLRSKVRPTDPVDQFRPCFNRQIGLCPGVCTGEISRKEYAKQIKNIVLFFEGKKKQLVKNLEKQMKSFAKKREFEKANLTKRTIFSLKHIQDVALIKDKSISADGLPAQSGALLQGEFRIESYDIAHMSGQNVVGVMVVVEGGEVKKSDYRKFKIKDNPGVNDTKALSEVLIRRLAHIEWSMPNLIVVDGGRAQINVLEKILRENRIQIPVMSVLKDERHKPKQILGDRSKLLTTGKKWSELERQILLANSEAHRFAIGYHRKLRNSGV
jgi:excinuclease ABC subunit C